MMRLYNIKLPAHDIQNSAQATLGMFKKLATISICNIEFAFYIFISKLSALC